MSVHSFLQCNLQYMNDGVDEIISVIDTQFALKYAVYYSKNKTSPLLLACRLGNFYSSTNLFSLKFSYKVFLFAISFIIV